MMDKFRVRFRLPYPNDLKLVKAIRSHRIFDCWCGHKKMGRRVLLWSCSFWVRCIIWGVGGCLMTLRSQPLLTTSSSCVPTLFH